MPSTRIKLSAESGCWGTFKVDRERPGVMESIVSNTDWNKFCDGIDEAMFPLEQISRLSKAITIMLFISILCIPIGYVINRRSLPLWSFFPPIFFFVATLSLPANVQQRSIIVKQNLEEFLSTYSSERQPTLSFNLKFNTSPRSRDRHRNQYYIQVYINPPEPVSSSHYLEENGASIPVASYCPLDNYAQQQDLIYGTYTSNDDIPVQENSSRDIVSAVGTQLSPATRLEELEKVKHLLTKEEYSKKRSQIIRDL